MKYGLKDKYLKEIIKVLNGYKEIDEAVLFGSRALGNYKNTSDIDIALKGKSVTNFLTASLKSKIEDESIIPYFFDFIAYDKLNHRDLMEHIDKYGIRIYKRDDN
ncbi:MAG: hypothetical protein CR988_02715 [Treponema sp.]|nr:MAG: hypothetical protein CR988_02715 [Treponema sp.]